MDTRGRTRKSLSKPSLRGRKPKPQRQAQILRAAFEEFAAHGYAATRLDDVAKRAGIAKGTIYLYFRDKQQLFRAAVRSLIQKRFDVVVGTLSGPAEGLLRELLSRMYTQVVRNDRARSIVRMLVAESGKFPQLSDIYHREVIAPGMKAVRLVLQRGIASGEFRNTRAVEFPQILV
ncbi:MAG: TetR/AcrR family transcriptional regulator [Terriglobia bacterium]|jgi:AcrR family transcriptional regulator